MVAHNPGQCCWATTGTSRKLPGYTPLFLIYKCRTGDAYQVVSLKAHVVAHNPGQGCRPPQGMPQEAPCEASPVPYLKCGTGDAYQVVSLTAPVVAHNIGQGCGPPQVPLRKVPVRHPLFHISKDFKDFKDFIRPWGVRQPSFQLRARRVVQCTKI